MFSKQGIAALLFGLTIMTFGMFSMRTKPPKTLELWATWYHIPQLKSQETGIAILDKEGKPIGINLDSTDWCKAAIEGTAQVITPTDTVLLNFAGRSESLQFDCRRCKRYAHYNGYEKTGKVLWAKSTGFGLGVRNYKLVPYRTIAVDQKMIPYGTVLFIPKAKGVKLPDGSIHDGYFFAGDTGSKIKGKHIDVFIGTSIRSPFNFIGSSPEHTFKAQVVSDQKIIEALKQMHL